MTEQEFIKKLPTIDNYYAIMCNYTRMPYVECDPVTYDDRVFIFLQEDAANAFVEEYKEEKMLLSVQTIDRAGILGFLTSLLVAGVNMVSFQGSEVFNIQLEKIVRREQKEGAPKPVENPSLQISMMYFMQGVHTAESNEEKLVVRQYEEEMMANIARAQYLVPSKETDQTDANGNKQVAFPQIKNANGELFIPLFTDINEFFKFSKQDGTTKFLVLGFNQIKTIKTPGLQGFIINPASIAVMLNEQHMNVIDERFCD